MDLRRIGLAAALFISVLICPIGNTASKASSTCTLQTSPLFNRISYEPNNSDSFKIYLFINNCEGMRWGELSINDINGIQVMLKNRPDSSSSEGFIESKFTYLITGLRTGYYTIALNLWAEKITYNSLPTKIYGTFYYDSQSGSISAANLPTTTQAPTTTKAPTTTQSPTTTQAPKLISILNDSLNQSSIELKNGNTRIPVIWTVQINDPVGRRLSSSIVGAQLCPASSVLPNSTGCIGGASSGVGSASSRIYGFRFLVSSTATPGQWIPRMSSPVSGLPELVGQSRLSVNNIQSTTTLAQQTNVAVITIVNESFSASKIRGKNPLIKYSVKINCGNGCINLPSKIEGRLCVTSRSFEDATCTGAVMQGSGKGNQRTYNGLFGYKGSPDSLLRSVYLKATINSVVTYLNGIKMIPWTS